MPFDWVAADSGPSHARDRVDPCQREPEPGRSAKTRVPGLRSRPIGGRPCRRPTYISRVWGGCRSMGSLHPGPGYTRDSGCPSRAGRRRPGLTRVDPGLRYTVAPHRRLTRSTAALHQTLQIYKVLDGCLQSSRGHPDHTKQEHNVNTLPCVEMLICKSPGVVHMYQVVG